MSVDSYRSTLISLEKEAATLHSGLAKQEEAVAKARAEADSKRRQASSTKSASLIQSYLRAAQNEDKKAVDAQKKVADIRSKLATNSDRQRNATRNLSSALKSAQATQDRQDEQRRRREKDHAREVARLSSPTVRHVLVREPEPERLRVLYLTSNPGADLRVDAEVNNVLQALRAAKHRDLIEPSIRPAATPEDLVNGINDLRPHVIHFSGHGTASGLLFDTASLGSSNGRIVGFEQVGRLLGATNFPPTLVVLNSCKSAGGAEALLATVPVVIAMAGSVDDMAAGLFARHFYAAIGGAQSIGHSVEQARTMVSIAVPGEDDLVTVCARPDLDVDDLHLVKPNTYLGDHSPRDARLGYTGSP